MIQGDYTEDWIPLVIFGGAAVLGGLLTFLLPETLNKKLPDTIEEAENLAEPTNDPDFNDISPEADGSTKF